MQVGQGCHMGRWQLSRVRQLQLSNFELLDLSINNPRRSSRSCERDLSSSPSYLHSHNKTISKSQQMSTHINTGLGYVTRIVLCRLDCWKNGTEQGEGQPAERKPIIHCMEVALSDNKGDLCKSRDPSPCPNFTHL